LARLFAGGSDRRSRRRRWTDRILGIAVGLVIGLGVLVYFVFVHSEGTIDAPKVNESGATTTPSTNPNLPAHPGSPEQPASGGSTHPQSGSKARPVPVVKVIGGAPPTGTGPKQLHFRKGEKVRFEIETDEPFSFEIRGLGITESIASTSIISFQATKTGQFPVIATATVIGVADLLIEPAG
jgi:heme/copper-type cytochrome/quinol oxidase subunit 2